MFRCVKERKIESDYDLGPMVREERESALGGRSGRP